MQSNNETAENRGHIIGAVHDATVLVSNHGPEDSSTMNA